MKPNLHHDHPEVVVWEMTRACRLACVHCRAKAGPRRDPFELSTREARSLIDELAEFHPRYLILSGGDPCRREDLEELIAHAARKGLRTALSPAAAPDFLVTDLRRLKDAGLACLSLSVDGPDPASHNAFRGISRAWEWTMRAAAKADSAGIPFQINTTISTRNLDRFDEMVDVVRALNPAAWTLFLIVPTGRCRPDLLPSPNEVEDLLVKAFEASKTLPFPVKTTEAPQYRRIALQHGSTNGHRPMSTVNDGRGFVFISHRGDVAPSGFLPLPAGNVRSSWLLPIYRTAPLFRALRNPDGLRGKCGRCEYRSLCGGSRARAYAVTGDLLAEEPLCPFQPGQ